ncbi:MAG: energy transducer TonB [Rikenellaceae bacterium]|nr:energy transducer TonB [Rikenellaceae bacterium]
MEVKKSPSADLKEWKRIFLLIGLALSLGAVCFAFLWTPEEYKVEALDLERAIIEEEEIPITREEIKPPAPQQQKVEVKVFSEILDVVTNDTKVETDMSFDDFADGLDFDVNYVVADDEEEIIEDAPLIKAEVMPTFQGGDLNTFRQWVQKQLRYPQIALENNITGRVTLQFVIEKDGRLTGIKVLASPDASLSEEAIRVVQSSPKWTPGKQRNQPVRVSFTLPVMFQLRH